MSHILTSTYPFSGGLVAASYACSLAASLGCPVRLQNAYTVPVTLGEMPMPVFQTEDAYEVAAGQLNADLAKLRGLFPDADISGSIAYGALADVLDETAGETRPLLTIIGNDEEPDTDMWIGGTAADMLRDAALPMLAVPQASVYNKPAHVCIAGDSHCVTEGIDERSAELLRRIRQALGLHITVLQVLTAGETPALFTDSALGRQLAHAGASYVALPASAAADEAIAAYAAGQGVDWLAVVPHRYGFWQGLFHKSHTAHMLQIAHLPVLALH